jgi:hypothetical protein
MRVDEPVAVGGSAPWSGVTWWRQLRQRWVARHVIRQRAAVAAFVSSWNPRRETIQPPLVGPAADVAAAQGILSTTTLLYGCAL